MENEALKKFLLYGLAAIVLGLLVIIVPLITFAEFNVLGSFSVVQSFSNGFRGIEGTSPLGTSRSGIDYLLVLVFSFVIAASAYAVVKRRMDVFQTMN